ncbi:putative TonB-dependent receptor [compost metagenome]
MPGVHSSSFGAGASRPVIRGLDGARVRVLSDGVDTLDASTISPDHAVSLEPLLVERIEVLKGPATLLYGGGAIGGWSM